MSREKVRMLGIVYMFSCAVGSEGSTLRKRDALRGGPDLYSVLVGPVNVPSLRVVEAPLLPLTYACSQRGARERDAYSGSGAVRLLVIERRLASQNCTGGRSFAATIGRRFCEHVEFCQLMLGRLDVLPRAFWPPQLQNCLG